MLGLIVTIYGLYFIAVGYHGNAQAALSFIGQQKQFLYWIAAILILYFLYEIKTTRPLVKPFIVLAIVATLLKQWNNIRNQFSTIQSSIKGKQHE